MAVVQESLDLPHRQATNNQVQNKQRAKKNKQANYKQQTTNAQNKQQQNQATEHQYCQGCWCPRISSSTTSKPTSTSINKRASTMHLSTRAKPGLLVSREIFICSTNKTKQTNKLQTKNAQNKQHQNQAPEHQCNARIACVQGDLHLLHGLPLKSLFHTVVVQPLIVLVLKIRRRF